MSRCFHCGQETGTLFVDAEGIARCVACHAIEAKEISQAEFDMETGKPFESDLQPPTSEEGEG